MWFDNEQALASLYFEFSALFWVYCWYHTLKLKNFIFWPIVGQLWPIRRSKYGFWASILLPLDLPSNFTWKCWSNFSSSSKLKFFIFFARNFECTWNARRTTNFSKLPYTRSPIACQQSLKISDQSDISSLHNGSSKYFYRINTVNLTGILWKLIMPELVEKSPY